MIVSSLSCSAVEPTPSAAIQDVPRSGGFGTLDTSFGGPTTQQDAVLSDAEWTQPDVPQSDVSVGDVQEDTDLDPAPPLDSDEVNDDATVADAGEEPPSDANQDPPEVCAPQCENKLCGPDNCGGSCGDCPPGQLCSEGMCIDPGQCTQTCGDKICGPDGCGGICGYCTYPEVCNSEGQCIEACEPNCEGKFCGSDGCGANCGVCEDPLLCGSDGLCYQPGCIPNCTGKVCGTDGCGGDCGICAEPKVCQAGGCQLGPCGTVTSVGECQGNVAVWCDQGYQLLEDDCGQYPNQGCAFDGFANQYTCQPVGPCTPKCEDKSCGSDSCGGMCPPGCPDGWSCLAGTCAPEAGGDCGGEITALGDCIAGVRWFCSNDKLYFEDCAADGKLCGWSQIENKFWCN